MREYYRVMEDSMANCGQHFPGRGITVGPSVFTDDVLKSMGESLRRAHRLAADGAADDDIVKQRLAKIDLSYEYTTRLMEFVKVWRSMDAQQTPQAALAAGEKALQLYEELVDEVVGNPDKWHGVVNGKTALLRPFVRRPVERLEKRVAKLRKEAAQPQ
jgi:hypothetical protein